MMVLQLHFSKNFGTNWVIFYRTSLFVDIISWNPKILNNIKI